MHHPVQGDGPVIPAHHRRVEFRCQNFHANHTFLQKKNKKNPEAGFPASGRNKLRGTTQNCAVVCNGRHSEPLTRVGRARLPPEARARDAGSNVLRHPILPDRALSR